MCSTDVEVRGQPFSMWILGLKVKSSGLATRVPLLAEVSHQPVYNVFWELEICTYKNKRDKTGTSLSSVHIAHLLNILSSPFIKCILTISIQHV